MARAKRLTAKTTTEAELRACVAQGMTWVDVANKTGITAGRIRTAASVLGIRSAQGTTSFHIGEERAERMVEWVDRLAQGDTRQEIAAAEGISKQAVSFALRKAGLPTTCRAAVLFKRAKAKPPASAATSTEDRAPIDAPMFAG